MFSRTLLASLLSVSALGAVPSHAGAVFTSSSPHGHAVTTVASPHDHSR